MVQYSDAKKSFSIHNTNFENIGLTSWLVKMLRVKNIMQPTNIQRYCIPHILKGNSVIGCSHIGSGKTLAYTLPVIQQLSHAPPSSIAVVLTATRESSIEIYDLIRSFLIVSTLKVDVIISGSCPKALRMVNQSNLIVATLGMLDRQIVTFPNYEICFTNVCFLILDEADRILKPAIQQELTTFIKKSSFLKNSPQTLLFAPFVNSSIKMLNKSILKETYLHRAYSHFHKIKYMIKRYVIVPTKLKEVYLCSVLDRILSENILSCIILARNRIRVRHLRKLLKRLKYPVFNLESHQSHVNKNNFPNTLRHQKIVIITSTDYPGHSKNVLPVDIVINFDKPFTVQDYTNQSLNIYSSWSPLIFFDFITKDCFESFCKLETFSGNQLKVYNLLEFELLSNIPRVYSAEQASFTDHKYY